MVRFCFFSRGQIRQLAKASKQPVNLKDSIDWLSQNDSGQNKEAYFHLLRICIREKNLEYGRRLHYLIDKRRYDNDGFLGNLMVKLYGACRRPHDARRVYDALPTSNSLIAANYMLEAYLDAGLVEEGRKFFDSVARRDPKMWNTMLSAYTQKGDMDEAKALFKSNKEPAVELWIEMIQGYGRVGRLDKAMRYFKAAPGDESLWAAIISAYAENGEIQEASRVYSRMSRPSAATSISLFNAYLRAGNLNQAMEVFNRIKDPEEAPWLALLQALIDSGQYEHAKEIFQTMPVKDADVDVAMIQAHSQHGELAEAIDVFERMGKRRTVAAWNAIMSAHVRNGLPEVVMKIYKGMRERYVKADKTTFKILLEGCNDLGAGEKIHSEVEWSAYIRDLEVNNWLLRMYVRLNCFDKVKSIFSAMVVRDEQTWSAMVAGSARGGGGYESAKFWFHKMVQEGFVPNGSPFRSLIGAGTRIGLVSDVRGLFLSMRGDYGLQPALPDFVCMIELLGKPSVSEELLVSMPFEPDREAWAAFMRVCEKANEKECLEVARSAVGVLDSIMEKERMEQRKKVETGIDRKPEPQFRYRLSPGAYGMMY